MMFRSGKLSPLIFLFVGFSFVVAQSQKEQLERIFTTYRDPDPAVRDKVREEGLAFLEQWMQQDVESMREVIPVFLKLLDSEDPDLRVQGSAIFRTVAVMRPKDAPNIFESAISQLLFRVDDPEGQVRSNIISTLASLDPPPLEAVEPFIRHLHDPHGEARDVAVGGLMRLESFSQRAAEAVVGLDGWQDPQERLRLLHEIRSYKDILHNTELYYVQVEGKEPKPVVTHPLLVAKVAEQLEVEGDASLRLAAVEALGAIGPPAAGALDRIREIAQDPDSRGELREAAASALEKIKGHRTLQ